MEPLHFLFVRHVKILKSCYFESPFFPHPQTIPVAGEKGELSLLQ